MANKSMQRNLIYIAESRSLRALSDIPIWLLGIGGFAAVVGLMAFAIHSDPTLLIVAFVCFYVGGVLIGIGVSVGVLALATNAIVGAIARSAVPLKWE